MWFRRCWQTPVGFIVDRLGARIMLIVGLALSSGAYALAGIFNSYWMFITMYGVAGLGNTVYHPSDYSLLSHHAPPERLSQIFSFHTFAGMVGSAAAPVTLVYMQSAFGWRGAYVGAAIFGFIVLAAIIAQPEPALDVSHATRAAKSRMTIVDTGWRLLISPPILLNWAFFILTSIMSGGTQHLPHRRARRAARDAARDRQYNVDLAACHERRRRARRRCAGRSNPPSRHGRGGGLDGGWNRYRTHRLV